MADQPSIRLNKVLRELNISLDRAVEFLNKKGVEIDARPTTKITSEVYTILLDEFETDKSKKVASHEVGEEKRKEKESLRIIQEKKEQERLDQIAKREEIKTNRIAIEKPKALGKIDLEALGKPAAKAKEATESASIEKEEVKQEAPVVERTQQTKEEPTVSAAEEESQADNETLKT